MRRLVLRLATLSVLILRISSAESAWAGNIKTGTYYTIPNFGSNGNFNGMEATIGSTANYTANLGLNDTYLTVNGGPKMSPTSTNNGTQAVKLAWFTPLPQGARISGQITGTSTTTAVVLYKYKLTDDVPVPGLGWQVTSSGAVYLENSDSSAIRFSNLS